MAAALLAGLPASAWANSTQQRAQDTGISGIWALANISFAGMRAQDHPSSGWRIVAFIFGFPGTLLTYFVVDEGSDRAYGIEIPRKR